MKSSFTSTGAPPAAPPAAAAAIGAAAVTSNSVSNDFTKSESSTNVISLNWLNKSSVLSFAIFVPFRCI